MISATVWSSGHTMHVSAYQGVGTCRRRDGFRGGSADLWHKPPQRGSGTLHSCSLPQRPSPHAVLPSQSAARAPPWPSLPHSSHVPTCPRSPSGQFFLCLRMRTAVLNVIKSMRSAGKECTHARVTVHTETRSSISRTRNALQQWIESDRASFSASPRPRALFLRGPHIAQPW